MLSCSHLLTMLRWKTMKSTGELSSSIFKRLVNIMYQLEPLHKMSVWQRYLLGGGWSADLFSPYSVIILTDLGAIGHMLKYKLLIQIILESVINDFRPDVICFNFLRNAVFADFRGRRRSLHIINNGKGKKCTISKFNLFWNSSAITKFVSLSRSRIVLFADSTLYPTD